MSDLSTTKTAYNYKLQQCKEGKMSPAQVDLYKRILTVIDSSSSVDDWQKQMQEKNMWFELGRAETSDKFRATAMAMKESIYPMLYEDYIEIADKVLSCGSQEEIDKIVDEKNEKIDKIREKERLKRRAFFECIEKIFDFMLTGEILYEDKVDYENNLKTLEGLEKLAEMSQMPIYANMFPFKPEQYKEMMEIAPELLKDKKETNLNQPDQSVIEEQLNLMPHFPAAEDYTFEQLNWMRINHKPAAVEIELIKQAQKEILQDQRIKFFAVKAPLEEAGDYSFENIFDEEIKEEKEKKPLLKDDGGKGLRNKIAFLRVLSTYKSYV